MTVSRHGQTRRNVATVLVVIITLKNGFLPSTMNSSYRVNLFNLVGNVQPLK